MFNIDIETIVSEASSKVWEDINGGLAAPLEEQDSMIQYSVKAKVLPIVTIAIPEIEKGARKSIKDSLLRIINDGYEAGHDSEFILMAVMAEISDDDE